MKLSYRYRGRSAVVNGLSTARVAFATNTLREATYFKGQLESPLVLREGLAALYDVVVSDFRYHPRDITAFRAWLEEQDKRFLANLGLKSEDVRAKLEKLEARLDELDRARLDRMKPFHAARHRYFDWAYENQYELAMILDPVITVHPDELSFEAFSRDESSYARLATRYDIFSKVEAFECGTTNIDFSAGLHDQFDRMRSYRETRFDVDPGGFTSAAETSEHREKKIDLPDSWPMGFLQVQSVMSMGLTHFRMAPVDLFNICRRLRLRRAKTSPRALRYELIPGEPVRVVLEPWEEVIELDASSRWDGKPDTIRTWGRDRLRTLSRLLPAARTVDVYLAGFGMPSFYVLDLGDVLFTLGLSGWTDNDWTSDAGKFDLLQRRMDVSESDLSRVHEALSAKRLSTASNLSVATGLDTDKVRSSLGYLCQVGRAMYDLGSGVYRQRELFLEPFKVSVAELEKAAEKGNPQAERARAILEAGNVRVIARRPVKDGFKLSGSARGESGERVRPLLHVDEAGSLITASCGCPFYNKHKLTQGPCEHILALRLVHMDWLESQGE